MRKTALALLLFTLFRCAVLEQLIQKPTVKYAGFSIEKVSLVEGTVLFDFHVTNPNPIALPVKDIRYRLKLQEKDFVSGNVQEINLKASDTGLIRIPCTIRYVEVLQTISELIKTDSLSFDLSGDFTVGPFSLPYHAQGRVPLPRLPSFSLQGLKITELTTQGATILATVGISNKNSFALPLGLLSYRLSLGEQTIASGESRMKDGLEAGGKNALEIPIKISFASIGSAILQQSDSVYKLEGDLKIDDPVRGVTSFPFLSKGKIRITR